MIDINKMAVTPYYNSLSSFQINNHNNINSVSLYYCKWYIRYLGFLHKKPALTNKNYFFYAKKYNYNLHSNVILLHNKYNLIKPIYKLKRTSFFDKFKKDINVYIGTKMHSKDNTNLELYINNIFFGAFSLLICSRFNVFFHNFYYIKSVKCKSFVFFYSRIKKHMFSIGVFHFIDRYVNRLFVYFLTVSKYYSVKQFISHKTVYNNMNFRLYGFAYYSKLVCYIYKNLLVFIKNMFFLNSTKHFDCTSKTFYIGTKVCSLTSNKNKKTSVLLKNCNYYRYKYMKNKNVLCRSSFVKYFFSLYYIFHKNIDFCYCINLLFFYYNNKKKAKIVIENNTINYKVSKKTIYYKYIPCFVFSYLKKMPSKLKYSTYVRFNHFKLTYFNNLISYGKKTNNKLNIFVPKKSLRACFRYLFRTTFFTKIKKRCYSKIRLSNYKSSNYLFFNWFLSKKVLRAVNISIHNIKFVLLNILKILNINKSVKFLCGI